MKRQTLFISLLLYCCSLTAVVVTDYDHSLLSSNLFTDITRDSRGYLWIATEYGLNKFDGIRFTSYYGDYGREGELHTSRVVRLYADTCSDGPSLWVLFYGALQYYDATTGRFLYADLSIIPDPALTAIFREGNELLLHSKGTGFWRIENRNGKPTATSLSDYSNEEAVGRYSTKAQWWDEAEQSVFYRDSDGTLWQGAVRRQFRRISPVEQGATYIPLNPSWSNNQPLYSCLVAPSGTIYVAQTDNGLRGINREGEQIAPTLLPELTGASSLRLRGGMVLLGTTTKGIYMYEPEGEAPNTYTEVGHIYLSTNKVKSMVEAEDGIVYAGMMEGGVMRVDVSSLEVTVPEGYFPTNAYVNKLALDSTGILWIGHYSGIDLYDTKNHRSLPLAEHGVAEGLLTAAVYDILFHKGKTYLATNKGLFVWNSSPIAPIKGQGVRCYTKEDGLPSNVICRMLCDHDGNIWMSTFHGISMFTPDEQPTFINYYLGSGMQAVRYLRGVGEVLPTGELLFPDDNGVTIISPWQLAGSPFTRPIVLSNLYMSGARVTPATRSNNRLVTSKAVDEAHEFWFSYLDNFITMQFSPLDMRDNQNVCYLYRFADEDQQGWHSTLPGESSITFSHLGYGRHVLFVRARDGISYSETAKWIIHIVPPFYLSWWAILIYIVAIGVVIVYSVYSYNRAKEQKLLREQLQFYINRSHELPMALTIELKGNDKALMEKMMDFITIHFDDSDLSVEMIADGIGISRAQLQRRVKEITGSSVGTLVRELRLKQAAELLRQGDVNIAQVCYSVGFNAPNVFSTAFKKYYGVSPKEYAAQTDNA